jgi:hypothetical protein
VGVGVGVGAGVAGGVGLGVGVGVAGAPVQRYNPKGVGVGVVVPVGRGVGIGSSATPNRVQKQDTGVTVPPAKKPTRTVSFWSTQASGQMMSTSRCRWTNEMLGEEHPGALLSMYTNPMATFVQMCRSLANWCPLTKVTNEPTSNSVGCGVGCGVCGVGLPQGVSDGVGVGQLVGQGVGGAQLPPPTFSMALCVWWSTPWAWESTRTVPLRVSGKVVGVPTTGAVIVKRTRKPLPVAPPTPMESLLNPSTKWAPSPSGIASETMVSMEPPGPAGPVSKNVFASSRVVAIPVKSRWRSKPEMSVRPSATTSRS